VPICFSHPPKKNGIGWSSLWNDGHGRTSSSMRPVIGSSSERKEMGREKSRGAQAASLEE
jgi:hypothetical protein